MPRRSALPDSLVLRTHLCDGLVQRPSAQECAVTISHRPGPAQELCSRLQRPSWRHTRGACRPKLQAICSLRASPAHEDHGRRRRVGATRSAMRQARARHTRKLKGSRPHGRSRKLGATHTHTHTHTHATHTHTHTHTHTPHTQTAWCANTRRRFWAHTVTRHQH